MKKSYIHVINLHGDRVGKGKGRLRGCVWHAGLGVSNCMAHPIQCASKNASNNAKVRAKKTGFVPKNDARQGIKAVKMRGGG